jgi:MoaA/NifB/PqqE/SkfB family radical SAM enzyme
MRKIELCSRCNNGCIVCETRMPPTDVESYPTVKEIKKDLENDSAHDYVSFAGGEPLLRNDITEIMEYINNNWPSCEIILSTNGRLLSQSDIMDQLKRINNLYLIVELHASSELHDSITGVQGSYNETTNGIKRALELGIKTKIRVRVSKINYNDLPNLVQQIRSFGIKDVTITPVELKGNALLFKDKICVRYEEIMPLIESQVKVLADSGVRIELRRIPYCVIGDRYHNYVSKSASAINLGYSSCDVCSKMDICSGISDNYAENYGIIEFKPFPKG